MIRWAWSRLLKWGWDYSRNLRDNEEICSSDLCEDISVMLPNPIRFKIQPAQGGTIIEVQQYDQKKHETTYKITVVADNEDITEHIGRLVTMELLGRQ